MRSLVYIVAVIAITVSSALYEIDALADGQEATGGSANKDGTRSSGLAPSNKLDDVTASSGGSSKLRLESGLSSLHSFADDKQQAPYKSVDGASGAGTNRAASDSSAHSGVSSRILKGLGLGGGKLI